MKKIITELIIDFSNCFYAYFHLIVKDEMPGKVYEEYSVAESDKRDPNRCREKTLQVLKKKEGLVLNFCFGWTAMDFFIGQTLRLGQHQKEIIRERELAVLSLQIVVKCFFPSLGDSFIIFN